MQNQIPKLDKIHYYKFYNLYVMGWEWDKSSEDSDMNGFILEEIANDFSNVINKPAETILNELTGESISTRSTEHLIYVYKNKDSDCLFYYLTNALSTTFKALI